MIGASADEVCLLAHRLRESSSERGGASATARNRTPEAVALPALAFPLSEEMFLLHEVVYTERDHFQHPMETLEPRKQTDPFWYDCLQLSILMAKSIFTLWNPRSPS